MSHQPTTPEQTAQFEQRKRDHIQLALRSENEAIGQSGLDSIILRHEALPEIDFSAVHLNTHRLNTPKPNPFFISSMTAGHQDAHSINQTLMQACQITGWSMGVGSQRRQLFDHNAAAEWARLRQLVPQVDLYGNIGLAQLIQTPNNEIQRLVDSLQASAMIIHTNPLQECMQPEGTPNFAGGLKAIATLCQTLHVPVIVKETGCGFAKTTLQKLTNIGVAAVDISGLGGTHWGRIEGQRAKPITPQAQAAITFKNWGISTVKSLLNATSIKADYEIWASGGVRTGLDAAKLLALGAHAIGVAKPMLAAALHGVEAVVTQMQQFEFELKIAMFCTGTTELSELTEKVECQ